MARTVRAPTDGYDDGPSLEVVVAETISDAKDVPPDALETRLDDAIDTTALTRLFESRTGDGRRGTISFPFEDRLVTIDVAADDTIEVTVESFEEATRGRDPSHLD
ncbi:HalOD1 output domain-containing protein [Haloarchaeobius sp. DFWS5]|uniref:HalOD1 output domain-containing protein n=1 Tax=Haloarchaeobius sp. DFWS5 TaxID=3446114 RepID=UPI003EBA1683